MIGVFGAGAFGTALAVALSRAGREVRLFGRSQARMRDMQEARENTAYLPGHPFPETLAATAESGAVADCAILLAAVPLQRLRGAMSDLPVSVTTPLVACCKGIELNTGKGPSEILGDLFPDNDTAILTGPSFAQDIAIGRPTALTLACSDAGCGEHLQKALTTQTLRLYRTSDTRGAELGGALKNVIAIACGAVIGADLGDSARAATMTRGFAEMRRIGDALGGRPETLAGLSGLGDLALTCTSELSRNYRLGLALGRGDGFDARITVEGAATARAMSELADRRGLDLPITRMVARLVDGTIDIPEAIAALMARPLKEE